MPPSRPAASSSWGWSSRAAAGAGRASTTASASLAHRSPVSTTHPARARVQPPRPACRSGSRTPRGEERRAELFDQRGHAAVEGPEQRRRIVRRRGDLGPQGAHEAAPLLGRGEERGIGGRGRHVVHRTGVDAADERVHQPVDHPLAELAGHERPDGAVADGPAHVGPGQQRVAGQAQLPAQPEDARSGRRPEPGGDAQRQALGQGAHAPAGPHAAPRARRSGPARRPGRPRGRGRRPRAGVRGSRPGPVSTMRPPNGCAAERAAQPGRRLQRR